MECLGQFLLNKIHCLGLPTPKHDSMVSWLPAYRYLNVLFLSIQRQHQICFRSIESIFDAWPNMDSSSIKMTWVTTKNRFDKVPNTDSVCIEVTQVTTKNRFDEVPNLCLTPIKMTQVTTKNRFDKVPNPCLTPSEVTWVTTENRFNKGMNPYSTPHWDDTGDYRKQIWWSAESGLSPPTSWLSRVSSAVSSSCYLWYLEVLGIYQGPQGPCIQSTAPKSYLQDSIGPRTIHCSCSIGGWVSWFLSTNHSLSSVLPKS